MNRDVSLDFLDLFSLLLPRLWDTKNNECIKKYRGHIANVNSVKFSPDGSWIASAGTEGKNGNNFKLHNMSISKNIECTNQSIFRFRHYLGRSDEQQTTRVH